jgi:hypothetical protein
MLGTFFLFRRGKKTGRDETERDKKKDRKRRIDEDLLLERIADALGCLFQIVVQCLLIKPASEMLHANIGCFQTPGETLNESQKDRYISLSKISPGVMALSIALTIDGIFCLCKFGQIFRRHPPGENQRHPPGENRDWNRKFRWYEWLGLAILTAIACVWMFLTIGDLNALDGSTQKEWSFGQWTTLGYGVIPALFTLARFVLRHCRAWGRASISSFKLI